ncbi:hypothetical protein BDF19DRAFT_449394 [Syncephalis fuscata]|nr:hypothetical protein BDF19DRAFT_449394 [Syncephalis fuscata]
MKLSIVVICTAVVALIAATAMVDAKPALCCGKDPAKLCDKCIDKCHKNYPYPSLATRYCLGYCRKECDT